MFHPIQKIKNFFKKRNEVITEIDPELMKQNEAYAHIAKAYVYEKGKRIKAENLVKDLTKPTDTSKIAEYLQEQKKELVHKDIGIDASVKEFLKYARLKKKAIHITSYNGEKDFGILKDIGFARNGLLGIYVFGINRPIISGKSPQDIFRNVAGLRNDARVGQIRINLNNDGSFVENIEQIEVPNVIVDLNRKINILNYDTKPFIERLIEKNILIDEQLHDLKNLEIEKSELTTELSLQKKSNEVLNKENQSIRTSISDWMNRVSEIEENYHNLSKNLTILEEDNEMLEEFKEKIQDTLNAVIEKMIKDKEKANLQDVIREFQDSIQWYELISKQRQIGFMGETGESSEGTREEKPMPKPVAVK